ncbi:hypothetical protein BH24ACT5_BH24ACT5_00360 [soil metagenome]
MIGGWSGTQPSSETQPEIGLASTQPLRVLDDVRKGGRCGEFVEALDQFLGVELVGYLALRGVVPAARFRCGGR